MLGDGENKMAKRKQEEFRLTRAVGSVFHDLGLPDADELVLKAQLMDAIFLTVENQGLTQTEIARRSGVGQPKISQLLGGKISGFSTDRLLHILTSLNLNVEIRIRPKPRSQVHSGHVSVLMAH